MKASNSVQADLNQSTSPNLTPSLTWIHKSAVLARIFDSTPDVFDDRVSVCPRWHPLEP